MDGQLNLLYKRAELLFPTNWYDGPIEGLATLGGEVCWFCGDPYGGSWALYPLDEQEVQRELEHKQEFERLVGTHWSFDVPKQERRQRDPALQQTYYKDKKEARSYTDRPHLAVVSKWDNDLSRY